MFLKIVAITKGSRQKIFLIKIIFRSIKVAKVESSTTVILNCGSDSFHSLLFLEGFGKIVYNDKEYEVSPGDSYFIPAGSGAYEVDGKFNILLTTV